MKQHFLIVRNALMAEHGWNSRVATLAARYYNGVDSPEDWACTTESEYGRSIISQGEYQSIRLHGSPGSYPKSRLLSGCNEEVDHAHCSRVDEDSQDASWCISDDEWDCALYELGAMWAEFNACYRPAEKGDYDA